MSLKRAVKDLAIGGGGGGGEEGGEGDAAGHVIGRLLALACTSPIVKAGYGYTQQTQHACRSCCMCRFWTCCLLSNIGCTRDR
jgi:hypothetical protein